MARLAIHYGMGAGERKTVGRMQVERAAAILPVARRMAVLAVLAQLPRMVVGMAIDATDTDMVEHRALVTARTRCGGMRPHQLESRGGMVERERVSHTRP